MVTIGGAKVLADFCAAFFELCSRANMHGLVAPPRPHLGSPVFIYDLDLGESLVGLAWFGGIATARIVSVGSPMGWPPGASTTF
jgi:hypothetical protein